MQITLSFEPRELPELLRQLMAALSGDASTIAQNVMAATAAAATNDDRAGDDEGFELPPAPSAATSVAPASSAAAEPKRRGRKPKQPDPNTNAIPSTDLAPPALQMPERHSNATPVANHSVAQMPPPTTAPAVPPAAAQVSVPLPAHSASAGATPTIDDLRMAYSGAEMRGVDVDRIMDTITAFGVERVSLIPANRWAEAIAKFSAL